jgi:hypothetical protein
MPVKLDPEPTYDVAVTTPVKLAVVPNNAAV